MVLHNAGVTLTAQSGGKCFAYVSFLRRRAEPEEAEARPLDGIRDQVKGMERDHDPKDPIVSKINPLDYAWSEMLP